MYIFNFSNFSSKLAATKNGGGGGGGGGGEGGGEGGSRAFIWWRFPFFRFVSGCLNMHDFSWFLVPYIVYQICVSTYRNSPN